MKLQYGMLAPYILGRLAQRPQNRMGKPFMFVLRLGGRQMMRGAVVCPLYKNEPKPHKEHTHMH